LAATGCTPCPVNSNSAAGASAAAQCVCNAGYSGSPCQACQAGTYCSGGVQSTCPANSDSAAQSSVVTDCKCLAGFTGADGAACTECPGGTYKAASGSAACLSCGADQFSGLLAVHTQAEAVIALSSCSACPAFSGTDIPGYIENCTCNSGYYGVATSCSPCPAGSWCSGGVKTPCSVGSLSNALSHLATNCTCFPGFAGAADTAGCTICTGGTAKSLSGPGDCTDCPSGTYSTATADPALAVVYLGQCTSCPDFAVSAPRSNGITSCQCREGYTGENGGSCRACETGQYKGTVGSASCTTCDAGTYTVAEASLSCTSCPANSNSPSGSHGNTSCTCNAGYSGPDGGPCVPCGQGTYKDASGDAACTPCPANTWGDSVAATAAGQCTACIANSHSPEGSTMASNCTCDEGRAGDTCAECPEGTWCTAGAKYNCSDHQDSPAGSSDQSACTCVAGYSPEYEDANCTACPLSTYKDSQGNTSCVTCPEPSITTHVASDSLYRCGCPPGTYGPLGGPCLECPVGYWCLRGAQSACAAFSSAPAGSGSRTDCVAEAGYAGPPGTEAHLCPLDHYCPGDGQVFACEAGTASAQGASTKEECLCLDGFTGPSGGPCTVCTIDEVACDVEEPDPVACVCTTGDVNLCSENAFMPFGGTDTSTCRCRAGYSGSNADGCTLCPADSYCPGGAFIIPCPANAFAPEGEVLYTACVCNDGWYGDAGGECTQCPPNSWCFSGRINECPQNSLSPAGAKAQSECVALVGYGAAGSMPYLACKPGTYCSDGVMYDCPPGHTSPDLATSIMQCTALPGYAQWTNSSDLSRSVGTCVDTLCEVGFYRGPCGFNQTGECVPCDNPLLSGASYISSGDPFDQNNCDWECDVGFTATATAGICIAGGEATIKVEFEYDGTLEGYNGQKDAVIQSLVESLGVDATAIEIISVTKIDGLDRLLVETHVTVPGGSEESMCALVTEKLPTTMQDNGLPPGSVVSCAAIQTEPPPEETPLGEGTSASDTVVVIGVAAASAGVAVGVGSGVAMQVRHLRKLRRLKPDLGFNLADDPPAALDAVQNMTRKAFENPGGQVGGNVTEGGGFAQNVNKKPVYQNPFLSGEGGAPNAGDMTMQTMGEWEWDDGMVE